MSPARKEDPRDARAQERGRANAPEGIQDDRSP